MQNLGEIFTGDPFDEEWREKAKCATDPFGIDLLYESNAPKQREIISYLCRGREACPVQLPCALDGLEASLPGGAYGGVDKRTFNKFRPRLEKLAETVKIETALRKQERIKQNTNPESKLSA